MKKYTEPMRADAFYHVFNRGINGENLFKEERNYAFFIARYAKFVSPVAETYAYCLLGNHFHFLIKTRTKEEILSNVGINVGNVGRVPNPADVNADVNADVEKWVSNLISRKFGHLFNSYAQAINKAHGRTGGLFEEPFRRIEAENQGHCKHLVYYINTNAQKHGFVPDFRGWPHSSYAALLGGAHDFLQIEQVMRWFSGPTDFSAYHLSKRGLLTDDLLALEIEEA